MLKVRNFFYSLLGYNLMSTDNKQLGLVSKKSCCCGATGSGEVKNENLVSNKLMRVKFPL